MYSEYCDEFYGRPVVDFDESDDWAGPDKCYRLREEYEDETTIAERLAALLQCEQADRISSLIVGAWSSASEGTGSDEVIRTVAQAAPGLPGLRALFLGEMTFEECEISWINQSDVAPLLIAYPQLELLRIRGGNGLAITQVRHDRLRELAIETGGLPRSVIREICLCEFPLLEHLELLLGEPNYGFDGEVEDLQPILSGNLFPQLRYLGLMNSMIANEIAAVLVNSPIAERIGTLDLSMGNLDGEGTRALHALANYNNIKRVNISHHYAGADDVNALKAALSCEVISGDAQQPDDEWRPILHAE